MNIFEHIKTEVENFNPTIWYPIGFAQVIRGAISIKKYQCVFFEKHSFTLTDGGYLSLEWYPLNYNNLPQGTPIIAFLLGSFGLSDDPYAQELALMV